MTTLEKMRLNDAHVLRQRQSTGRGSAKFSHKIYGALSELHKRQTVERRMRRRYGVDFLDFYFESIVLQLKIVDRRLAAKLIEDFHSGELTLELITELIPEDLRKEYNETYVQVTLTIDGELVQQCLSWDQ
ncbi:unnamed protein product, partial [Owenia fusiformis]